MATDNDAANEADQPVQEAPAASEVSSEPLDLLVDEIAKDCAICPNPIEPGQEYVEAAYGPVHAKPCSHQPKVLGEEDTGTFL